MKISKSISEQIIAYIQRHTTEDKETGCWLWNAKKISRDGYGRVKFSYISPEVGEYMESRFNGQKYMQAHKIMHIASGGSLTKDQPMVGHKCFNKSCCNPLHLKKTSHQENMLEMDKLLQHHKAKPEDYARLTDQQRNEVDDLILGGHSFYSIAKKYNIHISNLSTSHAPRLEALGHKLSQRK